MQYTLRNFLLCLFAFCSLNAFAQKETYDLVTYTIPNKWQKQQHPNGVQLSAGDEKKGTYSSILILRSSPTTATVQTDFNNDWETLIKKTVTVNSVLAMLITASGYNKKISMIFVSNTDAHKRDVEGFFASVELTKPVVQKQSPANQPAANTFKNGYKFTTTNFDNGWSAAEQAEGVMLTKGAIKALLHYPDEVTEKYYPYSEDALKTCWTHLVAGRYTSVNNLKFYWQSSAVYRPAKMAEAEVMDKAGKRLYVVLFQRDGSYWTELMASDKNAFIKEFNVRIENLEPMSPNEIFDIFSSLSGLNRFAVAPGDLTGKWSSNAASNVAYANIYTGAYAGGTVSGSNNTFNFLPGNQYNSTHNGGYGTIGNVQTYKYQYKGQTTVTDWSVTLTKRFEGKTEKFDAWFVASKTGRILMLKNATMSYALMKEGK